MKLSKRLLGILLLVTVLGTMVYGLAAANSDQQLPFKGSSFEYVTWEGILPDDSACPVFDVFVAGSGTATHLGAFTVVRHHCVTPPGHPDAPPDYDGPVQHDGTYEITAANGDTIWGSYSGQLEPTEFGDQGPIRGIITSPTTIDGGTGRFANAQGEYLTVGDYDLVADEGTFTFDGWINP